MVIKNTHASQIKIGDYVLMQGDEEDQMLLQPRLVIELEETRLKTIMVGQSGQSLGSGAFIVLRSTVLFFTARVGEAWEAWRLSERLQKTIQLERKYTVEQIQLLDFKHERDTRNAEQVLRDAQHAFA